MIEIIFRKQPVFVLNKRAVKIRRTKKVDLIDIISAWLEAEDTDFVKTVAYTVCIIPGLFIAV